MGAGNWEHFEHDADIGLRATAASREELFELMGEALTALITEPAGVAARDTVTVTCEAPDDAMLLVDWLNALVFEMATRGMLFGDWQVAIDGHKLSASIRGEAVDRDRHQPVVEVKGATYTALSVAQDSAGAWHAQCIVDV
ncbi:MAG: archease [Woeseiaceae bacterium]|nr:archease [Woeseiaceae bacterium]